METMSYKIQNLKCEGCSNQIKRKLLQIEGVSYVALNMERAILCFVYDHFPVVEKVKASLKEMGYPIENKKNSLMDRAKSYVSCAVGRLNN